MKRERVLLIFLLIILVNISFVSASVVINEVMPQGVEWIEIYNSQNEELNLSEWQIQDNQATDNITCYTITNCSLLTNATSFVIIDRNINISQITNLTINYFYVDDNALGGSGLNNNGENLSFFNLKFSFREIMGKGNRWKLNMDFMLKSNTSCNKQLPKPEPAANCKFHFLAGKSNNKSKYNI